MNNELIKIAYKNLLGRVASAGFLDQFIKETDLQALKDEELLISLVSTLKESRGRYIDKFLKDYCIANKDLTKNKKLGEKLLSYMTAPDEVEVIFNNFGEDNFIKNYSLMREVIKNTAGQVMNCRVSEKMRTDEVLRNHVMDLDDFSLHWFDLPSPTNKNLVIDIVKRDFHSFRKLSDEQKADKEIALATIGRILELKHNGSNYLRVQEQFYSHIGEKLKADKDISLLLAKIGFVEQVGEAYSNQGVMKELMGSYWERNGTRKIQKYNFDDLLNLPTKIFNNIYNSIDLITGIVENGEHIRADHESYSSFYKLLQKMGKEDNFIKEKSKKNIINGGFILGNIGETKYLSSRDFFTYFNKNLPEFLKELNTYGEMIKLKNSLNNKEQTLVAKKNKI